jgi:hypothetical protein
MKHLVYCIRREPAPAAALLPAGVEGFSVSLMAEGGLAAAYSLVPDQCVTPTVPRAAAYARVVEALHQVGPVLPFRYGCFLECEPDLAELLRARRREFEASLAAVEGCVEMGLRVLLESPPGPAGGSPGAAPDAASGRAYLASRADYYALEDARSEQAARTADALRRAFQDLFVKAHVEHLGPGAPRPLSLFFLVRKENVGPFRDRFQQLQRRRSELMLLTGPWPPYNFAASAGGEKAGGPQGVPAMDSAP